MNGPCQSSASYGGRAYGPQDGFYSSNAPPGTPPRSSRAVLPQSSYSAQPGGAMPSRMREPDGHVSMERMEWLRALLNVLWPKIQKAFERDLIRGLIEPQLAPFGLRFASAYLGDRPPELKGVRTSSRGQDVQIEFDVGFHPGNSINISLVFGPLKVAVSELAFSGHLCVTLVRLVPRKPVVCGVRIFFANAPSLSFSFGGLAKALPVPPQKIKEFVLEALASKVVLPNSVTVHVDSWARCWAEPDFLDYHALHSIPPKAVLRLRIMSIEGPLVDKLEPEGHSFLGLMTGRPPALYGLIQVGGHRSKTVPVPRDHLASEGLAWGEKQHDFIVDSPADQDVRVELYSEDTSRLLQCDELLARAKMPVKELAREIAEGRRMLRVGMLGSTATGGGHYSDSCSVVLACAYLPLLQRPPPNWGRAETLLLLSVDCIVGLAPVADGRNFSVKMLILPENSQFAGQVKSNVQKASKDQVTEQRVLHTVLEEARMAYVKDRLRVLYSRGARLNPDDACYVLSGLVTREQAAQLLADIEAEGNTDKEVTGGIEVMFGESLRLPIGDPRYHGLRVEVRDEDRGAILGIVEWSSLAFLAKKEEMEDELQAYSLDNAGNGRLSDASTNTTKIFLQRCLRVLGQ